ncbi:MAG: hypothetical protein QNJ97_02580 [Myxococcota bacterium]|nr:hypothetical protein [Myxococcota bacterium]
MAASVQHALLDRGIVSSGSEGCPPVTAGVDPHEDGIFLRVEDPHGRTSERVVADAGTAVSIIESWARSDLSDPLMASLLPVAGPPAPAPAPTPAVAAASTVGTWAFLLGIDGAASYGVDGSTWFGGGLSGCGRVGPLCLGAMARAAYDTSLTGDSRLMNTRRFGIDLLITVDLPLKWGSIALIPGIGVGGGWLRITRDIYVATEDDDDDHEDDDDDHEDDDDDHEDDDDDEEDDEEDHEKDDDPEYQSFKKTIDRFGTRLSAHVLLGIELKWGLWVVFGVSADVLVFIHTAPFVVARTEIAGEPRGYVRGLVGLRFGMP